MKSFAILAAALVPLAAAHYTFPDFIFNGATSAVTDVTSPEFRCYELDLQNTASQTQTATISAGSQVGFKANSAIYHPGYLSVYMSKATPSANSTLAGTGQTWFKVFDMPPTFSNGQLQWPSENIQQFTFTVPKSLPSGQYLIRVEHVALHSASTFQGAQFYISCAQTNVINGGNGSPSPLVSIPGVVN